MFAHGLVFVVVLMIQSCIGADMPAPDKIGADCAKQFPITPQENTDLGSGNFDTITAKGKCYVNCFAKGMGFVGANGAVNPDNVVAFYTGMPQSKVTADQVKAALTKCATANTGADECEKNFNSHKCVFMALKAA